MGSERQLADSELILLLEKKRTLLAELFQLVQKQLHLVDAIEFDGLLNQKDQCIEAMRQTDEVIAIWHQEYTRDYSEPENKVLQYIRTGLQDVLTLEKQFEERLQQEKTAIAAEIRQLGNHSQLRHYLKAGSAAGKKLSFRR
ncbi:MAG: hypothetical protein HQM14_11015 [SAR324 cluster bacterium]|nr:hypothetical protein [SAR324 cluster bacterium]